MCYVQNHVENPLEAYNSALKPAIEYKVSIYEFTFSFTANSFKPVSNS